jgi:hypothetical protein
MLVQVLSSADTGEVDFVCLITMQASSSQSLILTVTYLKPQITRVLSTSSTLLLCTSWDAPSIPLGTSARDFG